MPMALLTAIIKRLSRPLPRTARARTPQLLARVHRPRRRPQTNSIAGVQVAEPRPQAKIHRLRTHGSPLTPIHQTLKATTQLERRGRSMAEAACHRKELQAALSSPAGTTSQAPMQRRPVMGTTRRSRSAIIFSVS